MPPPPSQPLELEIAKQIFDSAIWPTAVGAPPNAAAPPSQSGGRHPTALILLSQTGGGKSTLSSTFMPRRAAAATANVSGPSPPVHLVADAWKRHHPSFAPLVAAGRVDDAYRVAAADARRWLLMGCERARAERRDVLVEMAGRRTGDVEAVLGVFLGESESDCEADRGGPPEEEDVVQGSSAFEKRVHQRGYAVEVVVLAVPWIFSRIGLISRYIEAAVAAKSSSGPFGATPRLVPARVHDETYESLLMSAGVIDNSWDPPPGTSSSAPSTPLLACGVDRWLLVRRDSRIVAGNQRRPDGTTWTHPTTLLDALLRERHRPLLEKERKDLVNFRDVYLPHHLAEGVVSKDLCDEAVVLIDEALAHSPGAPPDNALPKGQSTVSTLYLPEPSNLLSEPWKFGVGHHTRMWEALLGSTLQP